MIPTKMTFERLSDLHYATVVAAGHLAPAENGDSARFSFRNAG